MNIMTKQKNGISGQRIQRFKLKQHDSVVVCWYHHSAKRGFFKRPSIVEGIYCYGVKMVNTGVFPWNPRWFYSCGYEAGTFPVYILRKQWHLYPAIVFEWMRLKLPSWIGDKMF